MSVFYLKILALLTMMIDHYGAIFDPSNLTLRIIGRVAFPIFAFFVVEGVIHSKNLKMYGMRLLMFAIFSEFPFDYAFNGGLELESQNIFYTLFIGMVAMSLIEKNYIRSFIGKFGIVLFSGAFASLINADYGMLGILYISAFYFTKSIKGPARIGIAGLIIFASNFLISYSIQQYSLIALLPLLFYNGSYGPDNRLSKWFFYFAYPVHLSIFALINRFA